MYLHAPMYVRPTAIYSRHINYKTTRESMSLHSDLESFHAQQPSKSLSLLGVGVRARVNNSPHIFPPTVT